MWINSDSDEELILGFQRYAGRRIQRFPQRSPNASSFFGLGWLNLISYINVKKLLFIRSIAKMDADNVIRVIFEHRLKDYVNNTIRCRENRHRSPIFELLNVATVFGVLETVKEMILNVSRLMSKKTWSNLIWERAWRLEDANLRAANIIQKDNNLLSSTIGDTRYLTWWRISDNDYRLTGMCETMSRIVCHTSLLKQDDFRLKGMPMSNRTCTLCDMFEIESIIHILSQCTHFYKERDEMYNEIYIRCPKTREVFTKNQGQITYYLLGKDIPELNDDEMVTVWIIAGKTICNMYRMTIKERSGIG